ncbi:MAG: glutamate-5-semialdehyde dehydrogenase [Dehalococcoidales bacterium]|nr:glutamate-5-semialdehyde dehydrogenase [Dehalococcoidales bacterium]
MKNILEKARKAKAEVSVSCEAQRNDALKYMADSLLAETTSILSANAADLKNAEGKLSIAMIDRLRLSEERIVSMAKGIREVIELKDPVGRILEEKTRPNGLFIQKISVPFGVIGCIYESRPNVTSDVVALCIKSGNVCILKCGREAFESSIAIVKALRKGLKQAGLTEDAVQIIEDTNRESTKKLMQANGYVDLLIPRGGKALIKSCVENSTVPIIETGTGICHVYVDEKADLDMAIKIINNAKTSRPSVCNAEEVLLIDRKIAKEFLPMVYKTLVEERLKANLQPVELRLSSECLKIIPGTPAGKDDFDSEFNDYILAVKTVAGVKEACEHIAQHSTQHSETIVTGDNAAADYFLKNVDSATVYVNASTRFTDGGEFGLGCEIGISTQKLHARGPMGLEELTTYKYIIRGNGQIR